MTIGERLVDRERRRVVDPANPQSYEPSGMDEFAPEDAPAAVPVVVADGAVVCDVCSAANLAETGVMATTLTPDQLHSACRVPGDCACECEYARGGRCINCGRVRPADELESATGHDGASCIDRKSCADAMLEVEPAQEPPKPTSAKRGPSRPPSAPRPKAPKTPQTCRCGCEGLTGGGMYRPGHDAKHLRILYENIRGGAGTVETAMAELPSEALRAKLTKRLGL